MNEERFANELDRIAFGQEPQDPDALIAFARDVQMHQGAARLDPDRRAGIRRSLMQHATTLSASKSTPGGAGPLSQPALTDPALHNPWVRRRPAVTRTPSGWRGHMVKAQTAIAIMTVFALLIVGSAWYTNQQTGEGGPGPSATRYAAAPTEAASIIDDDGTPASGIFENDFDWTAPIDPAECRSYRQSPPSERIQNIRAERREFPKRQYVPFSFPAEDEAAKVAATARLASACANDHQNWLFRSDRWFYENDNPNIPDEHAFDMEDQLRASMEVSAALANYPVTDFVILLDQPLGVMTVPVQGQAFQPHHVVQLADGRLAIPSTQLMYIDSASDEWPFSTTEDWPFTLSTAFVLAQQPDGTWLVDEELAICIGDCNAMWSDAAEAFGVLAVPEIAEVTPVERREPSNKTAPNVATPPTNATPEAIADDVSPLLQLLSVLPAPLAIAEDGVLPGWAYADIDQRFEDLGLTDEALADDPTLPLASNAYGPLAHTTPLFDYAADTEFVEAIGFNPLEVDQVLITGRAPDVLTLLRGDWDEDTLTTAWGASGYTQHTTMNGITIWSLDPDGWVDPEHPIQNRMFQQMDNVVILDGGILAYAGYSGTIEMVIQTQSGEMASAIDDSWLQPLFSAVSDETISGIGFTQPGSTLYALGEIAANPNLTPDDRAAIEDQLRASREAVGPMPEYRGTIFAVEGDPAGEGAIVVQMRAFSGEDAEQIVRVIEWRWQNLTSQRYQRTFDSIMPLIDATTHDDIVTLRFDPQGAPRMWLELLQGGDLLVFAVDAGLPTGTPEGEPATPMAISDEDAAWWAWPNADECRPDEFPGDTIEPADYPARAYLPLRTPDREDAEGAALVARTAMACEVHYSTPPFASSRYRAESDTLGEDPDEYGQTLLEQNEHGRAIAEAFPITDPTEFGLLRTDQPSQESPPSTGPGLGAYVTNRHDPFTAVYIPSQAVQLADGRIAIPESLIAMEASADLAYRGDTATWERHYSLLVVLSNASGTWLIDEILPFCIGPDCDLFWEQNEETANRVLGLATPDAQTGTPVATPGAISPIDDVAWTTCPDYHGPYELASRTSDGVGTLNGVPPTWGPAEPPTAPCSTPGPQPPVEFTPVPLD